MPYTITFRGITKFQVPIMGRRGSHDPIIGGIIKSN